MDSSFTILSIRSPLKSNSASLTVRVQKNNGSADFRVIQLSQWGENNCFMGVELDDQDCFLQGTPYYLKEKSGKSIRDLCESDVLIELLFPEELDNR